MALKLVKVDHKLVHAQEVVTRYPIPFPSQLLVGGFVTSTVAEAERSLRWDERKTTLHTANLAATVHGRNDGWPFAPRSFEVRFYVNEHLVATRGWGAWPSCTTQEILTDIRAYIVNGMNKFKLEVVASWGPAAVGPDAITANIEAVFTGQEPESKTKQQEQMEKIVKYAAIGVGAAVFIGFVVPKIIEATRKRS